MAAANSKYDIYLIYKEDSPDEEIAIKLEEDLKGIGYRCCLQDADCCPGRFKTPNIRDKIANSKKVLILLSENSRANPWCQYMLNIAEIFHIENKGFNPIVLKLDGCMTPDVLLPYRITEMVNMWLSDLAKRIDDNADFLIKCRRTIKFVPVPCKDYNLDKAHCEMTCRYPHVCYNFIINGNCHEFCDKTHDLVSDQSREILRDLGFVTDCNNDALLDVYRDMCCDKLTNFPYNTVTGPCCYYNHNGCQVTNNICPFTHICKKWFLGECEDAVCSLSHDILNPQTERLITIFKIDTNQEKENILLHYRKKYPHKVFVYLKK